MILDLSKKWQNGITLKVKFLNGSGELQERVAKIARTWCEYANIKFDFADEGVSDIRVLFDTNRNDSKLGTDTLDVPQDTETVAFNYVVSENASEADIRRKVLHEFGHALGLLHEHLHPDFNSKLDDEKTIHYFTEVLGEFTEVDVIENLLRDYSFSEIFCSGFDEDSIMMYEIPDQCMKQGKGFSDLNTNLSDTDKIFIAKIYPPDSAQPAMPVELIVNSSVENETNFTIQESSGEISFKFKIEQGKRYYFSAECDNEVSLSVYTNTEKSGKAVIDYILPFYGNDSAEAAQGTEPKIELNEYVTGTRENTTEYYLRINLNAGDAASGKIKYFCL